MNLQDALTQEQIDQWKEQYGKIFKTTVGDQVVVWRKLKRKEYVDIMAESTAAKLEDRIYTRQDMITKAVALYPENIEQLIDENAGLATCVSDEVLVKSGFDIGQTQEM